MNDRTDDQAGAPLASVARLAETAVNDDVVAILKDLLERAVSGEVVGLIACGELTGREIFSVHAGGEVFRMLGALEFAKHRVVAERGE